MAPAGHPFLMNLPFGCFLCSDNDYTLSFWDLFLQDPQASYDVNGNDMDPMPRYDASNENK